MIGGAASSPAVSDRTGGGMAAAVAAAAPAPAPAAAVAGSGRGVTAVREVRTRGDAAAAADVG